NPWMPWSVIGRAMQIRRWTRDNIRTGIRRWAVDKEMHMQTPEETMSEIYGPSKKQTRSDLSFEDRREKFQEQFGFQAEPEPDPDDDFDDFAEADRNSMMGQYLKRHPE